MGEIVMLPIWAARDRDTLHAHLKRALDFPDYYGANLDALYDCLTDIVMPMRVVIPAAWESALDGYGRRVVKVFLEAAEHNERLHVSVRG
ncbi:barstar family protein [Eubacteriales bacterium OttesenSCG-928-N13]|nr:barstar family protein [Eubacteriales bacterium OttesenSCG-928-N13]